MPVGIDIAIAFIVGSALGLLIGWLMGRTRAPIAPGDSRLENELRQQLTQRETEISATREQYLNAGGLGILVGDGRLPHPGAEQIIETYYSLNVLSQMFVSLDYQWVKNPAYNTDRGPASIYAVRFHAQF